MTEERRVLTACQGWGCHENCLIEAVVVDGKIERTQRAVLDGPFGEENRICHKGIVAGGFPYLEERLRKPLKRVGERGEGRFEEISWDQALDEIGAKVKDITGLYGSRSLLISFLPAGYVTGFGSLGFQATYRFAHLFGADMLEPVPADFGPITYTNIEYGNCGQILGADVKTMRDAKHILIWGGNPIGFTRAATTSKILMDAQERGAKIVDIGLLFDTTAAKADQWVPIKAGTDAALALAMANYMIHEGLCDEDFITAHTVAPFLVREDNGKFLRESDIAPAGDPSNYVYCDVSGKALSIAPGVSDFADNTPDLNANVTVSGIACRTAYARLKEHVAPYTLESQEAITGVPAETARQVIREYCENQPATLYIYFGMRYVNAMHTCRAINLLAVLSGNMRNSGGTPITSGTSMGYPVMLNEAQLMFPTGPFDLTSQQVGMPEVLASFENPDGQQYKIFFNVAGNPLQNWPSLSLWRDRFLPNIELYVSFEVRMTDTARFADYVLPEANILERYEIVCPSQSCINLLEPAIEPQGEAKQITAIWHDFAERLGLGEHFDPNAEEWLKVRLQSQDPAFAGVTPPITLDRLKEQKSIFLNVPKKVYNAFETMMFATPSGRIELYCEDLSESGGAFALYKEPQIMQLGRDKYPLQYYPGRHRFFMQSQFQEFPELRVLAGKKSVVALNPATASSYGLRQNDWVDVFNENGSVRAQLILSETFPPGVAHLWYSYPASEYPTDPPTALSSAQNTDEYCDPVFRQWADVYVKRGRAAGVPRTMMFFSWGNPESYWDDLCDIRKAEVQ